MAAFAKDKDAEEIFKELGKNDGKKEKLFDSMKDVYMLAFLLGVNSDERLELKKKSSDPIKEEIFGYENKIIMDFIALYKTKDINNLKQIEETEALIHDMVEEYANGGIHILKELINNNSTDLDNLISVIKEFEKPSGEIEKVKLEQNDLAELFFEASREV